MKYLKFRIGDKFYRYEDGNLVIYRFISAIPGESLLIKKGISYKKVGLDYLDDCIRLIPDGMMSFNIVNMDDKGEHKDIVVLLNRKKDLDAGDGVPYCACRQQIMDFYTQVTNRTDIVYLGVSMSVDTTPEDVPYNTVLSCVSIDHSCAISVYLDDSISDILTMLPDRKRYDDILYKQYDIYKNDSKFKGYVKSLSELLRMNSFDDDFRRAFGIIKSNISVKIKEGTYQIDPMLLTYLKNILKVEILNTYVTRYSRNIDLDKIERDYILLYDKNRLLYIVGYDKGQQLNRAYSALQDKRDAVLMLKMMRDNAKHNKNKK